MQLVTLDFETFWDTGHTLTTMSPIEYVMHPDTDIISVSIKVNDFPTQVYFGDEIEPALRSIPWDDTMVIGHNMAGFDALILAFRYGITPKQWGCTQAMARPLHAKTCGVSLKALSEHYGLGVKDATALHNTKGKRLKDFSSHEVEAMREYNKEDTELCYRLFNTLLPLTPKREMRLIDLTVRMLTEPAFELDTDLLKYTLIEEQERKKLILLDVATMIGAYKPGLTDDEVAEEARKHLASASKFSEILRALDVPVPMKPSPSNPDKQVPALAKTDQAFIDLQNHKDPMVSAAAQARLGVKSTLLESRIERFMSSTIDGKLPVFLTYYGADTTGRWGGGGQLNQQNLPRVGKEQKPTDALRNSLRAPRGYKVVVADLSGIELRVNHFLWKVPSSMALFQADPEKADLYKDFASKLYNVERDAVSKDQRQIGKIAHLGLGFGAGPQTFQTVAKLMGGVELTEVEAKDVVVMWREAYSEIAEGWRICHGALNSIYEGTQQYIDPWGMCYTTPEGIKTPQGMIRYPKLHEEYNDETGKSEWIYGEGRNRARIYAGKIDENIVQHLAREIIADNMLSIYKDTGYRPTHAVHDELIFVAPDSEAQNLLDAVQSHMRTPPTWWPELVTWSEGDIAQTYGAAK